MNTNKLKNQIFFAILSGILLALSFPPIPMPFLAFIGLVPLLFLFNFESSSEKHRYLLIYITFFIYHTGSLWWISSWTQDTDIFLLISGIALDFIHPFFFFIPFAIYFYLTKKINKKIALYLFPLIFLTFEWLHSLGDIGFPWLTLGNTQMLNTYWIQFIDITGIWGASLLILYINVLVTDILLQFNWSKFKDFVKLILSNKELSVKLITLNLLVFLPFFYSFYAISKYDHKKMLLTNNYIRVAVVQPNINPWRKWEISTIEQLQILLKTTDSLLALNPKIKLFVYPETALPMISTDFNSLRDISLLQNWVNIRQISILTGLSEFYFIPQGVEPPSTARALIADPNKFYQTFNSAILVAPDTLYYPGKPIKSARKSKLTPFGEQIPFKEELPFLAKFAMWSVGISSWNKGSGATLLETTIDNRYLKIGNINCIESIFPNFVKDFSQKGANLFTLITNDGWYDYTVGPRQHYLIACMRAIENRRYIARSANTGISGFITPLGTSLTELPPYRIGALDALLPLMNEKTIYATYGDWLPITTIFVLVVIVLFQVLKRK